MIGKQKVQYLSLQSWYLLGVRMFGRDMRHWRFRCPACGNIQTAMHFRPFHAYGATDNSSCQECLGKYCDGRKASIAISQGPGPCTYTTYDYIYLGKTIIDRVAEQVKVFDFADPNFPFVGDRVFSKRRCRHRSIHGTVVKTRRSGRGWIVFVNWDGEASKTDIQKWSDLSPADRVITHCHDSGIVI